MKEKENSSVILSYLIVIAILLVLVGFGASRLIEAQTAARTAPTGSSTTRPLTSTGSTLPVPGMLSAKIDCTELAAQDFSKIPDAVTKITSATVVAASANSSQTCKIAGITLPDAMFVIQLPVTQWNGDYFQGGSRVSSKQPYNP